jgi:hypothetical protein
MARMLGLGLEGGRGLEEAPCVRLSVQAAAMSSAMTCGPSGASSVDLAWLRTAEQVAVRYHLSARGEAQAELEHHLGPDPSSWPAADHDDPVLAVTPTS